MTLRKSFSFIIVIIIFAACQTKAEKGKEIKQRTKEVAGSNQVKKEKQLEVQKDTSILKDHTDEIVEPTVEEKEIEKEEQVDDIVEKVVPKKEVVKPVVVAKKRQT